MLIPIPMQMIGHRTSTAVPWANFALMAFTVLFSLCASPSNWWVGPGTGPLSVLTYGFVHAGFWHLLSNMWWMWVFGTPVNRRLGNFYFLATYLGSIVAIGLIARVFSGYPLLGASGGVFAVVAVALLLMPSARVETHYLAIFPLTILLCLARKPKYPLFWFVSWGTVCVPASVCLLILPFLQVIGFVSWFPLGWHWGHLAHLLGFAFGVAAVLMLPDRISLGRGAASASAGY